MLTYNYICEAWYRGVISTRIFLARAALIGWEMEAKSLVAEFGE